MFLVEVLKQKEQHYKFGTMHNNKIHFVSRFAFLIIFSFCSNLFGQKENKSLKVEYSEIVTFIPQIVNYNESELIVKKNLVYYRTTYFDNVSSNKTSQIDGNSLVIPAKESEYFSELLINKKDSSLTENLFERYALKKFISVNEKLPLMKWMLSDETKKIGDFNCKKASVKFRGRSYTAYYTEEIAVNYGPWKFNGLLGLIIQIEDSTGTYKWRAKSIQFLSNELIKLDKVYERINKFKKMSYKDFDYAVIQALKTKFETIKTRAASRNQNIITDFSTEQWKEPSNQWRKQTYFEF